MARGRRTPDDFVDAAAGIVAESGWPSLTPAALALRMGVHATAVYRHFGQWNELVVAVFDRGVAEMMTATVSALPAHASPRDVILGFMRTVRAATLADPNLADCILAVLKSESAPPMPNLDAATAGIIKQLKAMGIPPSDIPVLYQAIEGLTMGSLLVDFIGHPHHVSNRRQRRRMSAVAEFEEFTRNDASTMEVSDAAFELNARLLLEECERIGERVHGR